MIPDLLSAQLIRHNGQNIPVFIAVVERDLLCAVLCVEYLHGRNPIRRNICVGVLNRHAIQVPHLCQQMNAIISIDGFKSVFMGDPDQAAVIRVSVSQPACHSRRCDAPEHAACPGEFCFPVCGIHHLRCGKAASGQDDLLSQRVPDSQQGLRVAPVVVEFRCRQGEDPLRALLVLNRRFDAAQGQCQLFSQLIFPYTVAVDEIDFRAVLIDPCVIEGT